ncbi:MAG: CcdC protein domain-containing protein [Pseudomonadota bacterium]
MDTSKLLQTVLPILIIGLVLAFRFRSMSKRRPLNASRLWIAPAILVGIALVTIIAHPPGILGLSLCFMALIFGGLLGWHRGKMMRIERDPETGQLTQSASPAAMILLVAIIAVRFVARRYFEGQPTPGKLDENTLLVTDVLLSFAVAMIAMTRVEMGIRARAILSANDGAKPSSD